MSAGAFERWLALEKEKVVSISAQYRSLQDDRGDSVIEFFMVMTDGKNHCRRVLLGEGKVEETARTLIHDLEAQSGFTIAFSTVDS